MVLQEVLGLGLLFGIIYAPGATKGLYPGTYNISLGFALLVVFLCYC